MSRDRPSLHQPCGLRGLATVDLSTIGVPTTWDEAAQRLAHSSQCVRLSPESLSAHHQPPAMSSSDVVREAQQR